MNSKKRFVRIVCVFLALIIVLTAFTGVMGMLAYRGYAAPAAFDIEHIEKSGKLISYIKGERNINISFTFTEEKSVADELESVYKWKENEFALDNYWGKSGSTLTIKKGQTNKDDDTLVNMTGTITNVTYLSNTDATMLTIVPGKGLGYDPGKMEFFIPSSYLTKPSSSDDKEEEFKSEKVVENILIYDKDGKEISEIDEDTPAFSLVITFLDYGMEKIDFEDIPDRSLSVFLADTGGLKASTSLRGDLKRLTASLEGTPRFQATFRDLTMEKGATGVIKVDIVYEMDGEHFKTELPLTVSQVKKVDDEEDKDKIAPLKPYIIVNQFSYGKEDIVAGSTFTLNLTYSNTSTDIPLENIKMTITPPEDVSIASSSNTMYVPYLGAKESLTHSVDLISKPGAEIGSAEIKVEFTYQYVDDVNKKREEATTTETIGVPLTQLDRFDVDPITEISDFATIGEPFYVTVSFINRGKIPTYNISAKVDTKVEVTAASQHFGNLEAGKSDSLELSITPTQEGELVGEIVVQYEDENANIKELKSPFSIFVQAPYVQEMPDNFGMEHAEGSPGVSKQTILFVIAGSMFIAAPIGYYFIKRQKAKETEAFDEDF